MNWNPRTINRRDGEPEINLELALWLVAQQENEETEED